MNRAQRQSVKCITEAFEINDDDILWEKFMCFIRQLLPWEEKQLVQLSTIQKMPVIAFIYSSEVMGDGHAQFLELYGEYIKKEDVINAFKALFISNKYTEIIEKLESIDKLCDECDAHFYQYGNEEIDEKIIDHVRKYHLDFFEYR